MHCRGEWPGCKINGNPILLIFLFKSYTNSKFRYVICNIIDSFGLENYEEMFLLTMDLGLSNCFQWVKVESFLTNLMTRWVCSHSGGINLLRYEIMPKKRCSHCLDLRKDVNSLSWYFVSQEYQFSCSKDLLFLFGFRSDFQTLLKTYPVLMFSWFRVDDDMMITSLLYLICSHHSMINSVFYWKTWLVLLSHKVNPINQSLLKGAEKLILMASWEFIINQQFFWLFCNY